MDFRNKTLDLSATRVMGIVNVTPDSFSDGGLHERVNDAVNGALKMVEAGADFIDIGGESTRPGAQPVSVDEELDRVIPVIERLAGETSAIISIDTSKPEVMAEAVNAGARLINDVRALREPGALEIASSLNVPVCLMHMKGTPKNMQDGPFYNNVVQDVCSFLQQRIDACIEAGISKSDIILDPGFGFGKRLNDNYALLSSLDKVAELGMPLLVGMSRKSMVGQLLDKPVDQRLAGSLALATIAAMKGANIIRVHDVDETVDAVNVVKYLKKIEE